MKLFASSPDIWLSIKDFLNPADVENILNTGSDIWKCIFKDSSWFELALTHDRCSPLLVGRNLSAYRPRKSSNQLYLALIANDYSGDLRYETDRFFTALQDGWVYNKARHEVYLPAGITLNIYDVILGDEVVVLPLKRILTKAKKGVYLEYCYYKDQTIRVLQPPEIQKWDPDFRTHPRSDGGWWNGSAHKRRDLKQGCRFILSDQGERKPYVLVPKGAKSKMWAKMA